MQCREECDECLLKKVKTITIGGKKEAVECPGKIPNTYEQTQ
jgi:hypothetical protein